MSRKYRKLEVTPDSLLGCRFFDRLERAERAYIARFCEGRRYAAGVEIIRHGESSRDVYFILSGRVQASLLTMAGKVVTFQELTQGDMFGELSALDGQLRSTSVVAIDESTLMRISGPNFKDLVARRPSLAEQTMLRLCELSRFLCERAFEARAYHVPDQIRLEVVRIVSARAAPDGSLVIESPPTQADIAQRVGTTREQVSRVMSDYARRGLIEQSRKIWTIPDVRAVCDEVTGLVP
jgi:CRP-like cAMP-binding protein